MSDPSTAQAPIGGVTFVFLTDPEDAAHPGSQLEEAVKETLTPVLQWAFGVDRLYHASIREMVALRELADSQAETIGDLRTRVTELERVVEHVKTLGLEIPDAS